MKRLVTLLLLAIAQFAQAADPAPIGRIFFTPDQRGQLDTLRTQKAVATQVRDEPIPENVTYNGIVRRNDGKTTVWVNNETMTDAELRAKQSIAGRVDHNGRILLQTPAAAAPMKLKVGQSAELLSGRVDESYSASRAAPGAPATAKTTQPDKSVPAVSAPSVSPGKSGNNDSGPKASAR